MNRTLILLAVLLFTTSQHAIADEPLSSEARLRRPVAVQLSPDEKLLFVANRRSGSLSIVDVQRKTTLREISLGQQISDLTAIPGGETLLATDESAHELLLINTTSGGEEIAVAQRLKVSPYPVSVVVSPQGKRCYVASLWSRRVTIIDLPETTDKPARIAGVIDLTIAPRTQLLVRDGEKLIVADSFGGQLAVIDTRTMKLDGLRKFPGHNIRGLGVSADGSMLLVSHQMLNELAHTVRNDVHWGLLMSNDLRWLKLKSVLDGADNLYAGAHMHPLGEAGSATGDPAELAVAANGTVVVALGGVGEIAIGQEGDFSLYRVRVGKRPTAVVVSKDGKRAFVANTFSDSISIVDLDERDETAEISLGARGKLSLVDRGEILFFDASLSHDSWMSCHSCHTNGHTNGMLNDNFSDASFGAPKRVLSLLGRTGTEPFAWNASAKNFSEQIRKSITNTMQGDNEPTDKQVEALEAFVKTLRPPPSLDLLRGVNDSEAIARGDKLFHALDCKRCHKPPTFTTPRTYNVGLEDKLGRDLFNPPSLLGVGQRGPYFHDNRAESLEQIFTKIGHQLERELSDEELHDLLSFLRSL